MKWWAGDSTVAETQLAGTSPDDVLREELWRRQPLMVALNLSLASLVGTLSMTAAPPAEVLGWMAFLAATQALRLVEWMRGRGLDAPTRARRFSAGRLTTLSALVGLAWGALALVLRDPTSPLSFLVPFVVAGMTAGSVSVLAGHPPAFGAFLIGIVGPYLVVLYIWPPPLAPWLAGIAILYMAGMGLVGLHLNRGLRRTVALYDRNRDLVAELSGARCHLEARVALRTRELQEANAVLADEVRRRTRSEEREREIGLRDPLTGLPNRLVLADRFAFAVHRARRSDGLVGIAIIDVDGFKAVNDTLGHLAGDRLLALLAARLQGALRANDTLARFGGDELVAIFADLTAPEAGLAAAERLVDAVGEPFDMGPHGREVSVSVGLALYPGHGGTLDELLSGADMALYQAKLRGRARAELLSPDLVAAFGRRRQALAEIRGRVRTADIELACRPRVRSRDGLPLGLDVRLAPAMLGQGPGRAGEIVNVARAGGFLAELEAAYLQCAFAEFGRGAASLPRLALTLAPETLARNDGAAALIAQLEAVGLVASQVEIGLEEEAWREPAVSLIAAACAQLRDHGVHLAVDDYGRGGLSLAVLQRAPIDVIRLAENTLGGGDALARAVGTSVLDLVSRHGLETVIQTDAAQTTARGLDRAYPDLAIEAGVGLDVRAARAWLDDAERGSWRRVEAG